MNKIDKWLFPFLGSDGKEVTEVQRYYAALAQNEDGFYPIGANGLWHGGIHFAAGSGQALKQGAGIRCIADGEVVAYRLNKSYPAVVYPGDAAHPAKYSSGFVLVRHKLVLPPEPPAPVPAGTTPPAAPTTTPAAPVTPGTAPATTPAAPTTPAEPPAADILTFYSLYMHVLNADAYDAHPGLDRPVHWAGPAGNKYKVGSKAKDTEPTLAPGKTGIRVRDAQKKVIGLLPQGDIIKLGAALAAHPTYFAVEATSVTAGYVFKAELDPLNTPDPAALNAIYILPTPKAVKAGDLLGHLGEYQNYQDVTHHPSSRPLLHLEVFSGDDVPAFIARSKARSAKLDAKTKTRLHIHAGARLFEPTPSDLAIPAGTRLIETADSPKSGLWVKATQMVKVIVARNSLTDYKAGTGTSKGSYKHGGKRVEFTGRFFGPTDADVTTDETVRKNLGYNRREILMPTGEPLWLERSALTSNALRSGWKNFPLQLSKPSANATVLSRVYTQAELDKRLATLVAMDDHNVRWFKYSATGWICEKGNPGVEWESSWDWPGFEVVKETSTPAEHFVRNPHILNAALPNESHNFQQRADAADSTGIFKKVREFMDGIDKTRPDGKLSVSEFKRALQTPWLADQVGRLIVNYESEWGGAATKWDELDSVMLDGVLAWKAEKIRIAHLSFWNGLRGLAGFPSPQVYHFHPVGLVGNFVDLSDSEFPFIRGYTGEKITDALLVQTANELGIEANLLRAIAQKESKGAAFAEKNRPRILYERHKFGYYSGYVFNDTNPDISSTSAKHYLRATPENKAKVTRGELSDDDLYGDSYKRLGKAYKLNSSAALKACSWGKFQIMGFNFKACGFDSVEDFVAAMCISEVEHLKAVAGFIRVNCLQAAKDKNWVKIAIAYNGPGYADNNYDVDLHNIYNQMVTTHGNN